MAPTGHIYIPRRVKFSEEQLTWDQLSGSYLKDSWSLVR